MPKLLCVYPAFPKTYWGAEYSMPLIGKKALLPPLGLLTVAALLPRDWEVRLADYNVRPFDPIELEWADVVFLSGMLIQREPLHEIARLARAAARSWWRAAPMRRPARMRLRRTSIAWWWARPRT